MISGTSVETSRSAPPQRRDRFGSDGIRGALAVLLLPFFCAAQGSSTPARHGGSRWGANYFPDVTLTTHEGESVRFFEDLIKGKVVVINFMYTTCPDVCPLETAKLAELQSILGDRVGRDIFMYSISIDPAIDSPEVLREYAERYQVGPGWWFLTGKERDITILRRKLGLYIDEIQDESSRDHNLSLLIGNQATGRWMKRSPFEDPYFLADQVGSWLHNWKTPAANQDSYENAPERLQAMPTGERLFRTRCAPCHTIGGLDRLSVGQSGRGIGPDLFNVVERRQRAWLVRWLMEPDKMLEEKDPLAIELYEKHNRVPMPNMDLREKDVSALLDYLELESRRVEVFQKAVAGSSAASNPGEAPVSCCRKNEQAVLQSMEGADATATGAAGSEDDVPPRGRPREFIALTCGSVGLGFFFLALAAFRGWRSRQSARGELRDRSRHGAGRGVTEYYQEASR